MESKKESIKLRVTKKEKDRLVKLSKAKKETLSGYMLRKGLDDSQNAYSTLPERIEFCTFMNDIYHEIAKSGNGQLERSIKKLYQNYTETHKMEV